MQRRSARDRPSLCPGRRSAGAGWSRRVPAGAGSSPGPSGDGLAGGRREGRSATQPYPELGISSGGTGNSSSPAPLRWCLAKPPREAWLGLAPPRCCTGPGPEAGGGRGGAAGRGRRAGRARAGAAPSLGRRPGRAAGAGQGWSAGAGQEWCRRTGLRRRAGAVAGRGYHGDAWGRALSVCPARPVAPGRGDSRPLRPGPCPAAAPGKVHRFRGAARARRVYVTSHSAVLRDEVTSVRSPLSAATLSSPRCLQLGGRGVSGGASRPRHGGGSSLSVPWERGFGRQAVGR